ncbi:ATP-dependent RNA helicase HrpA [Allokutzneria multivorans]|uniref:ATP-dependent RNA helicase HrpA n=1 Tax=Allokutzneria multivorans TaxID=1142134 RepID=A0ABP7TD74_9PSEU
MGTPVTKSPLTALADRLSEVMLRDERRLRRRLDGARRAKDRQGLVERLSAEVEKAELRVAQRRAAVPKISYPEQLPVSQRKDEILEAIRDHQVVIVAGETGSGKTTQIPKICLELGRGVRGLIGHTQPRRIAARTVSERVAEELGGEVGDVVGYKVRFTDQGSDTTLVKLMTDGILLAELQNDRQLHQYDTLIIDEAHERSLNIDFILGYLKQLLPRRPDLKVVITSATIDPERFSRHFSDAPIVEVSGRTYPVEVRYRPLSDPDAPEAEDLDQIQGICEAVEELSLEGPGDVLVFLSGEREIRDTAEALEKLDLRDTEVLPLYARLSAAEQHRVFQAHRGRRVVLATNVAETSLTVPGIKYVVDPGTARISRYSHRLKVQRLPIEAISQASANQRKGRCGRVSEGICIRLFSEEDFEGRPEFTEPEILRTNLASVILQMTSIGLGDIAGFPFLEPPDKRNISDGVQLLQELNALDAKEKQLTPIGRKLAQLPVDPRLGRMVLEAEDNGCAREVMIIAAALSIQDPRERPVEKQEAAAQQHARFRDKDSDFVTYLNLWNYLREQQKALSSNRFRKLCKAEFLNYLRVREWQDIDSQLRQVAKQLGITLNTEPADPLKVHTALLAGLLSHVGMKDPAKNEYFGARNAKFSIFPGSALFKKQPRWVMAAELVETTRLWGRVAAKIEPEWIEKLAGHLVKRNYSEPHWERKQGAVMALERVTLYGIPIVAGRKVNYGKVDPELCRELFIRHALVEGDWETGHKFFHTNRELLAEVEELEHRARRRDIVVDDETLFEFYDKRVGAEAISARHFDTWWKKTRREQPDLLTFDRSMLINERVGGVSDADYPDEWHYGDLRLKLTYQFEPGTDADGVTVHVPVAALNQLEPEPFSWQVPGLRKDLLTALLKSLPKALRRNFVPVPDYVNALLARLKPSNALLLAELETQLQALGGVAVAPDAWELDKVGDHLKITFRVVDEKGAKVAEHKDLTALKGKLKSKVQRELSTAGNAVERSGLTDWTIGELPRTFTQQRAGYAVTAYPALVDSGTSVAVRMFETEDEQRRAMWLGTRRLLLLGAPSPIKLVHGRLSNQAKLTLSSSPHGGVGALLADCAACAVDHLVAGAGGPAWNAEGFGALRHKVRAELGNVMMDVLGHVQQVVAEWQAVQRALSDAPDFPASRAALADIRAQLSTLVGPDFVAATGSAQLPQLPRYLKAIEQRIAKLSTNAERDRDSMRAVHAVEQEYRELVAEVGSDLPEVRRVRWMIEELRVSYFAQTLGTPYPVSDKRIYRAMDQI